MIYYISLYLKQSLSFFSLFTDTGIRCLGALCTSFLFSLFFGKWFIYYFQLRFKSNVREYTPESHQHKKSITMGGVFIIIALLSTLFLWCDFWHPYVLVFCMSLCGFGLLGASDDLRKIYRVRGIFARTKFALQVLCAFGVAIALINIPQFSTVITVPFLGYTVKMGWLFIPWAMFILVGCSNAVNLTDGLDGLATTVLLPNCVLFTFVCYFSGHYLMTLYLDIPYYSIAELAVICTALFGSLLGFLWYNVYPAQVIMGDVGSLSFGACLGLLALMAKKEFMLVISGGVFVVETLSVIAQVISVRFFKKRLFKMAPLHHHFELLGLHESTITMRFAIVTFFLCLFAVLMIKVL